MKVSIAICVEPHETHPACTVSLFRLRTILSEGGKSDAPRGHIQNNKRPRVHSTQKPSRSPRTSLAEGLPRRKN